MYFLINAEINLEGIDLKQILHQISIHFFISRFFGIGDFLFDFQ